MNVTTPTAFSPALALYAKCVVVATFALLFIGGLVTSHNAGMAVPDWPLSFGSLNPEGWWGNLPVRLEHGHRLFGASVGLLVTILFFWVWFSAGRTRALRWLTLAALIGVILQGVLGGLRVTIETAGNPHLALRLRILHACVAQAELCLLVAVATLLSRGWVTGVWSSIGARFSAIKRLAWAAVFAVYGQLIVGAAMRHKGAGLAIPTFPEANEDGGLLPKVHNIFIDLNFAHTRLGAAFVTLLVLALAALTLRRARGDVRLTSPAIGLLGLVLVQVSLGVYVIWHAKPITLATIHVVNGAAVLALSLLLALRSGRFAEENR